jgi:hypothetical protein
LYNGSYSDGTRFESRLEYQVNNRMEIQTCANYFLLVPQLTSSALHFLPLLYNVPKPKETPLPGTKGNAVTQEAFNHNSRQRKIL